MKTEKKIKALPSQLIEAVQNHPAVEKMRQWLQQATVRVETVTRPSRSGFLYYTTLYVEVEGGFKYARSLDVEELLRGRSGSLLSLLNESVIKSSEVTEETVFAWLESHNFKKDSRPEGSNYTFLAPNTTGTFKILCWSLAKDQEESLLERSVKAIQEAIRSNPLTIEHVAFIQEDIRARNELEAKESLRRALERGKLAGLSVAQLHDLVDEMVVEEVMDV